MRSLFIVCIAFIASISVKAQVKPEITDGTVLLYKIKEGSKEYNYTVTVTNGSYDNIAFDWKTSGSNPRSGSVEPNALYDDEVAEDLLISNFNDDEESLDDTQIRLFVPSALVDKLDHSPEEFTFKINSKEETLKLNKSPKGQANVILWNQKAYIHYTELINSAGSIYIGMMQCFGENNLVSFYKDSKMTMQLVSISSDTPAKPAIIETPATPSVSTKTASFKKMEATKFADVKKKYPILAKLEGFDGTKNGTITKPFSETYDYRANSNTPNPPSLVDCFICDLKILYTRKEDYKTFTGPITGYISDNHLPADVSEKIMQIYIKNDPYKTAGYRPWSHCQFVRSLSSVDRGKLTSEIEAYVKEYGILDVK
ncbi:MAG: hypothetical protein ABJA78_10270 [Ferruginibacter sp.]